MKQFACHRVYSTTESLLHKAVVCIDEKGEVISYAPFDKEVPFTQWIGGVILLASTTKMELKKDFKSMLAELTTLPNQPIHAWHLSPFDFEREEITSDSILYQLS